MLFTNMSLILIFFSILCTVVHGWINLYSSTKTVRQVKLKGSFYCVNNGLRSQSWKCGIAHWPIKLYVVINVTD